MRLFWKLAFEVIQTLQGLGHILELKEAAGQPEVGLQVAGIQRQGLQAVPQGVVVVSVPTWVRELLRDTGHSGGSPGAHCEYESQL